MTNPNLPATEIERAVDALQESYSYLSEESKSTCAIQSIAHSLIAIAEELGGIWNYLEKGGGE